MSDDGLALIKQIKQSGIAAGSTAVANAAVLLTM